MEGMSVSLPSCLLSRKTYVVILAASLLQACSITPPAPKDRSQIEAARKKAQADPAKERVFHEVPKNPSVPSGGAIEEFSVALNDTRY